MKDIDWKSCELCDDKLMPHKLWLGMTVDYWQCLGCGNSIAQKKEIAS